MPGKGTGFYHEGDEEVAAKAQNTYHVQWQMSDSNCAPQNQRLSWD
jgi:hypothetical protein